MASMNAIGNKIKSGNFTVSAGNLVMTAGNITLPYSTATVGVITIGLMNIHCSSSTDNCFVGYGAGNFTFGNGGGSPGNAGFGTGTMPVLSTGASYNCGFGNQCLNQLGNASYNVGMGYQCGYKNGVSGITTGSYNTLLGYLSGSELTGANSSNIMINNVGVNGDANTIKIGTQGTSSSQQSKAFIAGIYNYTGTIGTTGTAAVIIDSAGQIQSAHAYSADAACKTVSLIKSRGTSATPTVITANDALGIIDFRGHDGTAYIVGSQITSTNSGTVATNRIASDLKFYTHADSTAASTLRMTIEPTADITIANAHTIRSGTTAADTMLLGAYDVDGTADKTFITFTSNNTPTCDLDTAVTIGTAYIYRDSGTDVSVADGGTGLSTLTAHALYVGNGASAPTALAVGATGEILVGATGADCAWSSAPVVTTMYATTFDTNVAAAAVTLAGTTLAADGSDTDISITITPKNAGLLISSNNIQCLPTYSNTVTGNAVLVDSSGNYGVATSSIRFKDNVRNMGESSDFVMDLRPVTFNYKNDKFKKQKFGLIAEEVNEIAPSLVSYDDEGHPYAVNYHELPTILLNEIQKLYKRIEVLELKISKKEK